MTNQWLFSLLCIALPIPSSPFTPPYPVFQSLSLFHFLSLSPMVIEKQDTFIRVRQRLWLSPLTVNTPNNTLSNANTEPEMKTDRERVRDCVREI